MSARESEFESLFSRWEGRARGYECWKSFGPKSARESKLARLLSITAGKTIETSDLSTYRTSRRPSKPITGPAVESRLNAEKREDRSVQCPLERASLSVSFGGKAELGPTSAGNRSVQYLSREQLEKSPLSVERPGSGPRTLEDGRRRPGRETRSS